MKTTAKQFIFIFAFGILMMAGMRVADWTIPKPPLMVLVCIEDKDGPRNCKKYRTLEELSSD